MNVYGWAIDSGKIWFSAGLNGAGFRVAAASDIPSGKLDVPAIQNLGLQYPAGNLDSSRVYVVNGWVVTHTRDSSSADVATAVPPTCDYATASTCGKKIGRTSFATVMGGMTDFSLGSSHALVGMGNGNFVGLRAGEAAAIEIATPDYYNWQWNSSSVADDGTAAALLHSSNGVVDLYYVAALGLSSMTMTKLDTTALGTPTSAWTNGKVVVVYSRATGKVMGLAMP